jgi:hypothetical protein
MRKRPLISFVLVSALGLLIVIGPPVQPTTTRAQSATITLDIPLGGMTITRNPAIIRGSVSDPSITTVYINGVDSPVMVLGRRRNDLPGVPFPVVNGRFTGYAAFLGIGVNTVRATGIDRNGVARSVEAQVIYDASGFRDVDVVTNIKANSLREAIGQPVEIVLRLTNRTQATQTGTTHVDLILPSGNTVRVRDIPYNLSSDRRQTFNFTLQGNQLPEVGVYQVKATTTNTQGTKLFDVSVYFETYRAEDYPFVDVSTQAGVRFLHVAAGEGAGTSWADYDNDGDYDLFVSNMNGSARLYRNNGDGTFTNVTQAAGLRDQTILSSTRSGIWGDYNNDGYRDLFVTSPNLLNRLYRNNGNGTFTDVTNTAGIRPVVTNTFAAAWGDYDNDGLLDLYVGGNVSAPPTPDFQISAYPNQLYHNNGDGTFTEVALQLGVADLGPTLACQWADFDYDGDVDLFVVNDFSAFTNYPGTLYRNDGPDGRGGWIFTDIGADAGIHTIPLFGMGFTIGDFDGDGDQDYFASNLGIPSLYRNEGGVFVDGTFDAGVTTYPLTNGPYADPSLDGGFPNYGFMVNTWGVQFWDYDLDGWEDLYVCGSGMGTENFPIAPFNPNWLYHNNGDGTFTNVAPELGVNHPGRTRGVAMADYDNDGDLDIYLANNDQYGVLLRNDLPRSNDWIKIELRGTVSNRDAIGSRIELTVGGRRQIRLYPNSDPQASQPALEQVFGLGQATAVDSITVHWPSGIVQTLTNIDLRSLGPARKLVITESRR